MGIYIRGMEMPPSCFLCKLSFMSGERLFCSAMKNEEVLRSKIDSNCPLVELPPHGRLIDADALCKTLRNLAENEYTPETFANWIENHIDAILEAEEGETWAK